MNTVPGASATWLPAGVLFGERLVDAPPGHEYWPSAEHESADALAHISAGLGAARDAGVGTIVDVTPIDGGRDFALFETVAAATRVKVVFSTGIGTSGAPTALRDLRAIQLGDVYIRELSDAVPGTSARAGVLTVSVGDRVDAFDDVAVLAVAFAHAETGAPVVARASAVRLADLVGRLIGRGIDPDRIVACGIDGLDASWGMVEAVAKHGALLGCTGGTDILSRGAAIAHALRRYGPSRVCIGSGVPFWTRPLSDPASDVVAPGGLGPLFDAILSFGVSSETLDASLRVPATTLFESLREAADG